MSKQSFESFIVEFKGSRENVINIIKIVLEQNKVEEFKKILLIKKEENKGNMREFIKHKYYEFVESIQNINNCKSLVKSTEDSLQNMQTNIEVFLTEFGENFLDKMKIKENLTNIFEEKEKLKNTYIFFAYINKAFMALKEHQYESTIRLMHIAEDNYLKTFPNNSNVSRRGKNMIGFLKSQITSNILEKMNKWLIEIDREQIKIGETLFKKVYLEEEKINKSSSFTGGLGDNKTNIRTTKNIVDNLLLIRNTSNLNYMMNKNSLLKSSVLAQSEIIEEFDIINMVSNIDLNFLEQAYEIYRKVDMDMKFIDHFRNFRQSRIPNLVKINHEKDYDSFFSEILGFIIIQIAVFELLPVFYTKRQFEEIMNSLIKEIQSSLNNEFDSFKFHKEYIQLEKSIFVLIKSIDRVGLSDRIGIDVKAILYELLRSKVRELNFIMIRRYNDMFTNFLFDEKCNNIEINNKDDFLKYASQYYLTLDDNSNPISGFIYPFRLPYTYFVVEINENYKKYIDDMFIFIKPIYTEYETILSEVVRDFLKKLNEVFITFINNSADEITIILCAQICNNIRYVFKSYNFFSDYVKKAASLKININFDSVRSLKEAWTAYEEIIYENLRKKMKAFISDLQGENWLPDKPNTRCNSYVEDMIAYLNTIYVNLQMLSNYYVENCFRDAISFMSRFFLETLFDPNIVKNYNIYSLENLKLDICEITNYLVGLSHNHPGMNNCVNEINNLLNFFFQKKFEIFLDIPNKSKNFPNFSVDALIRFLKRFKNLKKSSEQKGRISESDITSIIKKLQENIVHK